MDTKILVLGAGAIGGYYVRVSSRAWRKSRSQCGMDAKAIGGVYDAVLLACKGYDLEDAMNDIGPAVGPKASYCLF